MKTATIFIAVLTFGFVVSAIAEPATTLQPEACAQVEVNYDLTPSEITKGYDWAHDYIKLEIFQVKPRSKGKVRRGFCWFKFDPDIPRPREEVKRRIENSGEFLVADLWELNAFGTAKPAFQRQFQIISLGTNWRAPNGKHYIPFLYGKPKVVDVTKFAVPPPRGFPLSLLTGRSLGLGWYPNAYYPNPMYLTVRKELLSS